MNFLGLEIRRKGYAQGTPDDILGRLRAILKGNIGDITPDNCMKSPTVQAIVQSISRRIAVSPVHVFQKGTKKGRDTKEKLPDHPVAKLLKKPNSWQTSAEYWLDATSCFVRWGRYFAFKSRGSTGPIRELIPLHPQVVGVKQHPQTYAVSFLVTQEGAGQREYPREKIHYVRGPSRDFLCGNSPVEDVKLAIGLEIAAEEFGASFFNNGALPLMILKYMQGSAAFKNAQDEKKFVEDFQNAFGGGNRHKALLLPKGIETGEPVKIENDKAQFLETRKYQRTVIAGAFGVPPHLVGDLERATFNNVEQQDKDFTSNVVQPIATAFEAAMERDLLTDEDRAGGICIRFNLDSTLRADFKSRTEAYRILREIGIVSSNEVREREGLNPISAEDGGDDYLRPGNMLVAGEEQEQPEMGNGKEKDPAANQKPE